MEAIPKTLVFLTAIILLLGCASTVPPAPSPETGTGVENVIPTNDTSADASNDSSNDTSNPPPSPDNTVSPPPENGEVENVQPSSSEYGGLTPATETSLIFQALNDGGISDAAVEYQTDQILIAFNKPTGTTEENAAYFALGVASSFAQPEQMLYVQVFSGNDSTTYSVKADTVQKYANGKLNENQLKQAVQVT
jgi:hypothetical protein